MQGKDSKYVRGLILHEYYQNAYQQFLFSKNLQGFAISYFERSLEKFWLEKRTPRNVLELGGGEGEHLKFVNYVPLQSYVSFDLRLPSTDRHIEQLNSRLKSVLEFKSGNAETLPFSDGFFDRVKSTCLLHHVDDVLAVLFEARRVTCPGGELAFLIPTDPGILNRTVKRFYSFQKLKKITNIDPSLIYALDHKNHFSSILRQIQFVFQQDQVALHYRPFFIRSWNLNLLLVVKIIKES